MKKWKTRQRRLRIIGLRVSDSEFNALKETASSAGKNVSEFIRDILKREAASEN